MHSEILSSAEIKTIRESLSLTVLWVAQHAGVTERSVQYAEKEAVPVSRDVSDVIKDIDSFAERYHELGLKRLSTTDFGKEIVLFRYRTDEELWDSEQAFREQKLPAKMHAALIDRLRRSLQAKGYRCRIMFQSSANDK